MVTSGSVISKSPLMSPLTAKTMMRGPEVLHVDQHQEIRFWSFEIQVQAQEADAAAGRWRLRLELDGYGGRRDAVDLVAGEVRELTLGLARE